MTNANAAAALRARRWIGDDAAPWVPALLPALVGAGSPPVAVARGARRARDLVLKKIGSKHNYGSLTVNDDRDEAHVVLVARDGRAVAAESAERSRDR